jgi:hypothetical protein
VALERKLLGRGIGHRAGHIVTFIVHASKGDAVAITFRLQVVAAVAKARSLADTGWEVFIIGPDDLRYSPADFDRLLACSVS